MTEGRWPDGCPSDAHQYDGICAMTKPETLQVETESDDEREGGAT